VPRFSEGEKTAVAPLSLSQQIGACFVPALPYTQPSRFGVPFLIQADMLGVVLLERRRSRWLV
jgi:hypothetical protein